MNYGRWLVVLLIAASMGITAYILIIPGERYQTLTTSDSGWLYDSAAIIENTNALPDNMYLSHAPYGMKAEPQQLQPLTTVMLYRAVNAINPSVTLMDVVKYWSPFVFALALIPIFLIGRELGGNIAGVTAVFLAATITDIIYWGKVGAYDREAMQTLFGALTMFFVIKLFKATRKDIPKFAILSGLTSGLFALAWSGWLSLMAVVVLGVVLVLALGFVGKLLHGKFDIVGAVSSAVKSHLHLIIGVVGMIVVATVVLCSLAAVDPVSMWVGFAQTLLGYVGISVGGGGVSMPTYASEATAAGSFGDTFGKFYSSSILTVLVMALLALGLMKLLWSRRKVDLLAVAWFVILLAMVWPGKGVARFDRLWWPLLPCLAGVGLATLASLVRKFTSEYSAEWAKWIYHPLLPVLTVVLVSSAFVVNAGAVAAATTPPTEWRGISLDNGFLEAFDWIRNNTTTDNIVSIQWSFGHLFTGTTQHPSVTDGSESPAWQGTWEQSGTVRPPDYILFTQDSTGMIYGINATRENWAINGRRIDVQWFPLIGPDELKWYLKTYRDSYGCKIDYLIFSADEYYTAYNFYQSNEFASYYLWAEGRRLISPSSLRPTVQDNKYIFDFGGDRSAVVLEQGNVYLNTAEGQQIMDGYAFFTVSDSGGVSFQGFSPSSSAPQINEDLVVIMNSQGSALTAWLVEGTYGAVARTAERAGVLAFNTGTGSNVGDDNAFTVAYTSPDGAVKIIQVNHQFIA